MLEIPLSQALRITVRDTYYRCKIAISRSEYPKEFDDTQSIFIHVPKTAGTSVAMAVYGKAIPHSTWRTIRNLCARRFAKYFKFGVIRDPVTRFSSAFSYLKKGGMNEFDAEFGDTVLRPFANANELVRAMMADPKVQQITMRWLHFIPQSAFVADAFGRSQMDFLIRFENLGAGFETVARRLGCESRQLPRLNVTHEKLAGDFDAVSLGYLNRLYKTDFRLWKTNAV